MEEGRRGREQGPAQDRHRASSSRSSSRRIKDKAYPEAIKAIAKKITLEGNIEGNKPEEKITRMKAAIATAPAEMHPVMNAILAHWYWHYFQQNRWRFIQRTADRRRPRQRHPTWDLPRIFAEIDKTFDKALAAEKELKATPIAQYDVLLEKGTIPDKYRPTLFDFLAFDALSFYTSARAGRGRSRRTPSNCPPTSPIFDTVDEFLKWDAEDHRRRQRARSRPSSSTRSCSPSTRTTRTSPRSSTPTCTASASAANKAVGEKKNASYKAAPGSVRRRPTPSTNSTRWPASNWPASSRARAIW